MFPFVQTAGSPVLVASIWVLRGVESVIEGSLLLYTSAEASPLASVVQPEEGESTDAAPAPGL